jgi:hypothetical protein
MGRWKFGKFEKAFLSGGLRVSLKPHEDTERKVQSVTAYFVEKCAPG